MINFYTFYEFDWLAIFGEKPVWPMNVLLNLFWVDTSCPLDSTPGNLAEFATNYYILD